MRCDQIQEHIIDFVYDEGGAPPANNEIREHLRTCPSCREELQELKQTRKYLQLWKDEPPLRSFAAARVQPIRRSSFGWKHVRYAAIAAMVILGILAVTNTQIAWNKNGFSFSTHLFSWQEERPDYYTKTEIRTLMKEALDDSESRTNEMNYLMMQKMLDTVEQDRWMDLRLIRSHTAQNRNRN